MMVKIVLVRLVIIIVTGPSRSKVPWLRGILELLKPKGFVKNFFGWMLIFGLRKISNPFELSKMFGTEFSITNNFGNMKNHKISFCILCDREQIKLNHQTRPSIFENHMFA